MNVMAILQARVSSTRLSRWHWHYDQQLLGYNYRTTDIHSALNLFQLKRLDGFIVKGREIVERYNLTFFTRQRMT